MQQHDHDIVVPDYLDGIGDEIGLEDFNVPAGLPVPRLSYKGKEWSLTFKGLRQPLQDPAGYPAQFVDVAIVRPNDRSNKLFYADAYSADDSDGPPDCWSFDAVMPAPDVARPVSSHCQTCPNNVFGTGPNGVGKACRDYKGLALLPVVGDQLLNVAGFEAPVLLTVPPASLGEFSMYLSQLKNMRTHPLQVVTRLTFKPGEAHPVIKFSFARFLRQDEVPLTVHWRNDPGTIRVLGLENRRPEAGTLLQIEPEGPQQATKITHQATPQPAPILDRGVAGEVAAKAIIGGATGAPPTAKATPAPVAPPADPIAALTGGQEVPARGRGRPRKPPVAPAPSQPAAAAGNGVTTIAGAPAASSDAEAIMARLRGMNAG